MINIDINRIRKEDAIAAHALLLTLKHFNYSNDLFSISYEKEKYYVFMGEEVDQFDTFDQIPMYIIGTIANNIEEETEFVQFYTNVLKVGFNNSDALDYLNFYSETEKKLTKVK